jgi:hypothetical protein
MYVVSFFMISTHLYSVEWGVAVVVLGDCL